MMPLSLLLLFPIRKHLDGLTSQQNHGSLMLCFRQERNITMAIANDIKGGNVQLVCIQSY
jgi:hypothetical protein